MAPVGGTVASLGPGKSRGHGQSPALSSALDGRQVAAANSTLNAWSGRRQPSWLANATPVQPTPRPAARPPSVTNVAAPFAVTPATETTSLQSQPQPKPKPKPKPQAQAQPQLQPPPPSRPSPQPRHPSQNNLRQQPQSSDQPAPSLPASAHSRPASSQPPHPVTAAGPPRLSTSPPDPALPSPAASDEPSPRLSLLRGGPNTGNACPASPHSNPPTTEAHFVLNDDVTRPLSSPQSRVPTSLPQNGRSASPLQMQPLPVAPLPEEMADHTQTPTVAAAGNVGSVPADTSLLRASKRRRYENGAIACLEAQNAKGKISAYLQEMGGEQALEEVIERPRFFLLYRACREGDVFFVALHQLFCSWTVSQILVHALCDEKVHDTSLIDNAFGIMGTILKANSKLRVPLLQWFADFPVPLLTLQHDRFYAQTINQVLNFLICVSKRWSIVNHDHLSQGYPLLMSELINTFNLHSPLLQSIVFRASRRTLGVPDSHAGKRLEEVFRADQEKHWNPEDGTCSLRLEGPAYEQYNNSLVQRYKSLVAAAKAQRTTSRRSSHSPSIPPASTAHSSATSSPSLTGEYFQFDMAQAPRPAPSATSAGRRVSGNGQNIQSPSPTYSPIAAAPPMAIPNTTATFPPQLYNFPTHPTSPYPSHNVSQHGQYGPLNPYVQQNSHLQQLQDQARQYQVQQQLRLQQQQLDWQQQQQYTPLPQQLQQLQHLEFVQRKRSQPGAVPSPRPSPIQATRVLPGQVPMARHTQPQNINSQPVSPAPFMNSHQVLGYPAIAQQSGLVDPSRSPQVVNTTQPFNVQPPAVAALQRQPNPAVERLFPVHPNQRINLQEYPHTPYEKRSADMSLHQAHLRSPKRILKTLYAGSPERHYQAIKSFALEPAPITPQGGLYKFSFNVTDKIVEKLTLNERVPGEVLLVNRFKSGSLRIRARCCCFPMATGPIPDHDWVTSDTTWPDQIFMSLDNQPLEVMRKQHHSKDLPVELSSFIHQGENTLSVALLQSNAQRKQQTPYIAVEIVEVLSHSAILDMVRVSGNRPANETWEVIQNRLATCSSGLDGDDNDLEMSNDGISIDLADPFTAMTFQVPVRGKACKHLECFDLENWLNTRLGKKSICICGGVPNCKCPKEPSFVDKWRCPFCDGDARPYSLYIDEFLVEVRSQLEQANQLRTKSITVYANRSWQANDPAGDDDTDVDSDDDGATARANSKTATSHKASAQHNVIEIDDD
ncbi:hypothetical protein F5B22DRAFT_587063 [Xylaria bambusicola]|uniref:uncharacterized protein n=1 Tax=Xylaria bambusicola TaxID=326684 RepID=UPI0020081877|nr:uncharacterized protein F5B22DRAFT_587063 [Xylaria bambusicola]KAI0526683.1 hypothetical protein F5B22DRAFT_587063 [Xylaria bambusicola]